MPASPEQILYRAVIAQAVEDATATVRLSPPKRRLGETRRRYTRRRQFDMTMNRNAYVEQGRARSWLTGRSHDLWTVCEFAGIDPEDVHARAITLESRGWPSRLEDGWRAIGAFREGPDESDDEEDEFADEIDRLVAW